MALSLLSSALLLSDDFIQQLFSEANQAELEPRYVAIVWLLALGLWLLTTPPVALLVLSVLALFQLMQLSHVSYFGRPLDAMDLHVMTQNWGDVREGVVAAVAQHWHAALAVALPYGALLLLHGRLQLPLPFAAKVAGVLIVAIILGAKPYRATYRSVDAFAAGPTRSGLHNSINAFSFFAMNYTRQEFQAPPQASFQRYAIDADNPYAAHVWVVVADSVRSDRLSVLGYERPTTPFLDGLRAQHNDFVAKRGIAAGVSTAVSLPVFLNVIREPGQNHLLQEQPHNLFRLAKNQGYETYWLSSQESKLLSHAGSQHIDVRITREDYPLLFEQQHDHALATLLERKRWGKRNFVVINLRSAHSPYEKNYRNHPEPIALWPTSPPLPEDIRRKNAYDNAVRYVDDLLAEIYTAFSRLEGPRYLLFTSDHGQLLGENAQWGHNELMPEVIQIPVVALAEGTQSNRIESLRREQWVSHYEAGVWLASLLGVTIENPNLEKDHHYVKGKLLWGDNSIRKVIETQAGLQFHAPVQLSEWVKTRKQDKVQSVIRHGGAQ